ncbi:hypothetical protein [uncultured Phocaeicola sp.]|uniref:hypothetical protein n=1 Tax=uncultured Phocaeicola sp. TaxID=990718 RepID=UPI0015B16982|nr:hypothetical protein [uncultured Phocaeicola sp.]
MESKLKNNQEAVCYEAIVVGKGGYAVNYGHLDISEPAGKNYFEYKHQNIPNQPGVVVKNIAVCAMAALEDNPDQPGSKMLASHATLINRGVIDIHFSKIYALYKERKAQSENPDDTNNDTVRCYAMVAGTDSLLINEGTINVYMDQEIDAQVSLYGCAMWANAHSTMLNRGTIHFIGDGSWQSYIRGVGSMDSHLQIINDGEITVDLKRAYQTRILHTAGQFGSLTNNGVIRVKTSGRIMVLGCLAGTRMMNNGEIDVTSLATFLENKVSYHYQFDPLATAMYEHFLPNNLPTCPAVNRGTIKVHLVGTELSGPNAVAFGFYCHQVGTNGETPVHRMENEGTIEVTQEGPVHYNTAEVGVNIQSVGDFPVNVKIGRWKTRARDFASSHDLFMSRSARFDLTGMDLQLTGTVSEVDKNELVYQLPASREAGETFEVRIF